MQQDKQMLPGRSRLSADDSVLLVVDIQDAFREHILEIERVIDKSRVMIEAAKLLELPIIVTEQYPKGLGHTVEELREVLGDCTYYDKVTFSCCQDEKIAQAVKATQRQQIIMVGIETHVCVAQTTYDLLAMDLQIFLAVDAISSRCKIDRETALQQLRELGVVMTTTEAAIFEMMHSSKHPKFREISKLVK